MTEFLRARLRGLIDHTPWLERSRWDKRYETKSHEGDSLTRDERLKLVHLFPNILGKELGNLSEPDKVAVAAYQIYNVLAEPGTPQFQSRIVWDVIRKSKTKEVVAICMKYPGSNYHRSHYLGQTEAIEGHLRQGLENAFQNGGKAAISVNRKQFSVRRLRKIFKEHKMQFHKDKEDPKIDHVIYHRFANYKETYATKRPKIIEIVEAARLYLPNNVDSVVYKLAATYGQAIFDLLEGVSKWHSFKPKDIKVGFYYGMFDTVLNKLVGVAGTRVGPNIRGVPLVALLGDLGVEKGYRRFDIATMARFTAFEALYTPGNGTERAIAVSDVVGKAVRRFVKRFGGHMVSETVWVVGERKTNGGEAKTEAKIV